MAVTEFSKLLALDLTSAPHVIIATLRVFSYQQDRCYEWYANL
jgi:hypothetical protein